MTTRRHVVEVEGLGHGTNPIPVAVTLGGLLFSGTVPGVDRASGEVPDDRAAEIANAFENLDAVLTAAGASWGDIGKVDVSLRDKGDRPLVNDQWVARFPDAADRPARHTAEVDLPGAYNIQLEVIAVLPA